MEDGMNPPPSQAMTADPSVVAAAVRVCDDVLLTSPTLTFMPAVVSNVQLPKTITIPIANSAGMEVLRDEKVPGSIDTPSQTARMLVLKPTEKKRS
mgnify:CR=1 FL=1